MRQEHAKPGVLVADDDPLMRIMVQRTLEQNGFDVWAASNGADAMDLYRSHRHRIDLALLDVHMPVLDGPHTLDALRSLNPEVPVCFMSGDTGEYSADELIRRGALYVLAKPFRLGHLVEILRSMEQGVPTNGRAPSTGSNA
jgi:CheY-like chemotaxis protein